MYGESRYQIVTMTDKMIVSDPDFVRTKETDANGRLYLGTDYANKEIRCVIKVLGDKDKDGEDEDEE